LIVAGARFAMITRRLHECEWSVNATGGAIALTRPFKLV
jgi:hypothetical protein